MGRDLGEASLSCATPVFIAWKLFGMSLGSSAIIHLFRAPLWGQKAKNKCSRGNVYQWWHFTSRSETRSELSWPRRRNKSSALRSFPSLQLGSLFARQNTRKGEQRKSTKRPKMPVDSLLCVHFTFQPHCESLFLPSFAGTHNIKMIYSVLWLRRRQCKGTSDRKKLEREREILFNCRFW